MLADDELTVALGPLPHFCSNLFHGLKIYIQCDCTMMLCINLKLLIDSIHCSTPLLILPFFLELATRARVGTVRVASSSVLNVQTLVATIEFPLAWIRPKTTAVQYSAEVPNACVPIS